MRQRNGRIDDALVLDLIPFIYDAATDPTQWPDFLEAIGRLYPGSGRALWFESGAGAHVDVLCTAGFEPQAIEAYAAHYGQLSPWTDVMENKPSGHVHTAEMIVPQGDLVRTEFYNDWLRPQKFATGFGATVLNEGDRQMYFSILPPAGQVSDERDLAFLRRLVPHLQRAAAIHSRFARIEARADSLEALIDRLDVGAILITEGRRIALANRRAEDLLRQKDGLVAPGGTIGASINRDDSALRQAIQEALATGAGRSGDGGHHLLVTRPSGKRPLSVLVTPLFPEDMTGTSRLAGPRPAASILVTDPENDGPETLTAAARMHGFTEAEATLVNALLAEGSLPRAAGRLGVSHETARSHLKSVFAKSGTNSQAQLVRLILTTGPVQTQT